MSTAVSAVQTQIRAKTGERVTYIFSNLRVPTLARSFLQDPFDTNIASNRTDLIGHERL